MAQTHSYHTKEYFWGETFYTDRPLSVISDVSMPGMVEDHSGDSEASGDDDYHLSSTKLFDTYHDKPPRAVSTLLTQVNRTYAMENHHYPNFAQADRRSTRRKSNVLQTLESKPDDPRPTNRTYATWPLCNDSNQLACNRPSVPQRPSLQRSTTNPNVSNHEPLPKTYSTSSENTRCNSPKSIDAVGHERSYFEHSDDEGSDDEECGESLTGKAMKRLHIRSPSASKIGDITTGSLRRLFRSKKL